VLVVEAVGSRSQSVGIGVDLRGASQDRPQKGDLARRMSSNPLTRAMMVQRWVATGRVEDVSSVSELGRSTASLRRSSKTVCRQYAELS